MNRLIFILLGASYALTAVAAVAENALGESRARLAVAWQQAGTAAPEKAAPAAPAAASTKPAANEATSAPVTQQ